MIKRKKIGVVVPAHNEEKRIGVVIKTMPKFVDLIIIVDDASTDKTISAAKRAAKASGHKIEIIALEQNVGVGGAISVGYERARDLKIEATAVMAGDAQMDPKELRDIVQPIMDGEAEYVKGNRLIYGEAWHMIPKIRYLGNSILSFLTKIVSGYWHVADSQTGYAAISLKALQKIDLKNLYKRYGFPNDLLVCLNVINARVKEIPIKPIYHTDGKSGIRLWKVIPTISCLLWRRFWWRLKVKYIIKDFHPLVFFYASSFVLNLVNIFLFVRLCIVWISVGRIPSINALALFVCLIMATQFSFFAMWFDMDYNKDLKVK